MSSVENESALRALLILARIFRYVSTVWASKGPMMSASPKHKTIENISKDFHNEVHERIKLLLEEYSLERKKGIRSNFDEVVSFPAIDILKSIVESEELDAAEKLSALSRVYEAAAILAEQVQQPELSKIFWSDRPMSERKADPFQWVKDHYPSYGAGLHQGHVYHHDRPLYRRLHDSKPWPNDFLLCTRAEVNNEILKKAGRAPTLKEIAEAAPPNIREMIRLHELERARKRKRAPR